MVNLRYCLECQRIFCSEDKCEYCLSSKIKDLKQGTSVNVIGTKNKGMILKYKDGLVSVIIRNEGNEKILREYKVNEVRKIL